MHLVLARNFDLAHEWVEQTQIKYRTATTGKTLATSVNTGPSNFVALVSLSCGRCSPQPPLPLSTSWRISLLRLAFHPLVSLIMAPSSCPNIRPPSSVVSGSAIPDPVPDILALMAWWSAYIAWWRRGCRRWSHIRLFAVAWIKFCSTSGTHSIGCLECPQMKHCSGNRCALGSQHLRSRESSLRNTSCRPKQPWPKIMTRDVVCGPSLSSAREMQSMTVVRWSDDTQSELDRDAHAFFQLRSTYTRKKLWGLTPWPPPPPLRFLRQSTVVAGCFKRKSNQYKKKMCSPTVHSKCTTNNNLFLATYKSTSPAQLQPWWDGVAVGSSPA